ncbi:putative antirestriction protein [Shigella sonnei]|nr:putative antirestriction protein [Shigella sonnei]
MQYAKPVTLNVEECDRLSFLPYLFGNDFLYAEASGRQARLRQAAAGAPASLRRTRWRGFGLSLRSDA